MAFNTSLIVNDKIATEISNSKTEIMKYDSSTPWQDSTDNHSLPSTRNIQIPHVEIGAIEQSIIVVNGLDIEVEIEFKVGLGAANGQKHGDIIFKEKINPNGRHVYMPEKSYHTTNRITELAELRMPIPQIIMTLRPLGTASSGDFEFTLVRRF